MRKIFHFDIKWSVLLLVAVLWLYFVDNAGWSYPRLPVRGPSNTEVQQDHNAVNHPSPQIKPASTVSNSPTLPVPINPILTWTKVPGAVSYELEITNKLPENPNETEPSRYRLTSSLQIFTNGYHLDLSSLGQNKLFWRVRALDEAGDPVGVFSDIGRFVVSPEATHYSATFGDSITHGGGAVSYSPADIEYDYQTYLHFPTVNLGHSGDTTADMVERFNRDVLPFHPIFLLIMGGTNSIRGGTPASDVIDDLKTIAELCQDNDIRPIFLTLPPINPDNIEKVFQEQTSPQWRKNLVLVNDFIQRQTANGERH